MVLFTDFYVISVCRVIPLYGKLLAWGVRVQLRLFTKNKKKHFQYSLLPLSWPSHGREPPRTAAQLSLGLLKQPLPVSPWLPRHSPPQCKSRSSWRSGSACGALNSSEWLTSPAPTGYRVGSRWGVRHSFYENAKHDLIKETHRRKKKKRQFALKRNRSMNILTIWQETFLCEYRKLAKELVSEDSAGLAWCCSENSGFRVVR